MRITELRGIKFPQFALVMMAFLTVSALAWPLYMFFALPGLPGLSPFTLASMGTFVLGATYYFFSPQVGSILSGYHERIALPFVLYLSYLVWMALATTVMKIDVGEAPAMVFLKAFLYRDCLFIVGLIFFLDLKIRRMFINFIPYLLFFLIIVGFIEFFLQERAVNFLGLSRFSAADSAEFDKMSSAYFRGGQFRVSSMTSHPIIFGQLCGALLPIVLHKLKSAKTFQKKAFYSAIIAFALAGVFLSTARSALVCLFSSCSIYFYLSGTSKIKSKVLVFSLLALTIAGFYATLSASSEVLQILLGRTAEESSSSEARLIMYDNALEAVRQSPVFGFGPSTSALVAGLQSSKVRTIDNYFLSVIVDGGIPALLAFASFLLTSAYRILSTAIDAKEGDERRELMAVSASSVALIVGLPIISLNNTMILLYLLFAFCLTSRQKGKRQFGSHHPAAHVTN